MKRPLLVGLSGLRPGENLLEFEHEPGQLGLDPREVAENPSFERLVGTMRERVTITRDGTRLLVRGRVAFRARLQCAACGTEYERDFDEELGAEVVDLARVPSTPAHRSDPAEPEGLLAGGDLLDLATLVRDAVHLAVPIAPVCRPGCRGVCPCCGADRNEIDCGCRSE
ncbi:DUF177 domain-containing protein [candidate division WOR-3 bacterium]|nr:DUF177 domain-containing protein [candidate division WOR-3 bacterium]